tara:strand:+ start:435 stop:593 length:159 start_codon:yes stop_codon:yes gene_type:complete
MLLIFPILLFGLAVENMIRELAAVHTSGVFCVFSGHLCSVITGGLFGTQKNF